MSTSDQQPFSDGRQELVEKYQQTDSTTTTKHQEAATHTTRHHCTMPSFSCSCSSSSQHDSSSASPMPDDADRQFRRRSDRAVECTAGGMSTEAAATVIDELRQRVRAQQRQLKAMHNLQLVLCDRDRQLNACRQELDECRRARERAETLLERATLRRLQEEPHHHEQQQQLRDDVIMTSTASRHGEAELGSTSTNRRDGEVKSSGDGHQGTATKPQEDLIARSGVDDVAEETPAVRRRTSPTHEDEAAVGASAAQRRRFHACPAARSVASNDLVDKLMQQNARLKKAIRDLIAAKGMTISEYLDEQERQDVMTQRLQFGIRPTDRLQTIRSATLVCDTNASQRRPSSSSAAPETTAAAAATTTNVG